MGMNCKAKPDARLLGMLENPAIVNPREFKEYVSHGTRESEYGRSIMHDYPRL